MRLEAVVTDEPSVFPSRVPLWAGLALFMIPLAGLVWFFVWMARGGVDWLVDFGHFPIDAVGEPRELLPLILGQSAIYFYALALLPMAIEMAILVVFPELLTGLRVGANGINFVLPFGQRRAKLVVGEIAWEGVEGFEFIGHDRSAGTLLLRTRPKHWPVRFTWGVETGRYKRSDALAATIISRLTTENKTGRFWFVPRAARTTAWIALGVGLALVSFTSGFVYGGLMTATAPEAPARAMAALPDPLLLALLMSGAVIAISYGFGALSAYRKARPHLALLAGWLYFVSRLPLITLYIIPVCWAYEVLLETPAALEAAGLEPPIVLPGGWHFWVAPSVSLVLPAVAFAAYATGLYLWRRPGPAWDYTTGKESVVSG